MPENFIFFLFSITPSFSISVEMLSISKYSSFQIFFFPNSSGKIKIKIILSGKRNERKIKKRLASLGTADISCQQPGSAFPGICSEPAAPSRQHRRAYRDGGFSCCVPVLQQGFGQLSLGDDLHRRKKKCGDTSHINASFKMLFLHTIPHSQLYLKF